MCCRECVTLSLINKFRITIDSKVLRRGSRRVKAGKWGKEVPGQVIVNNKS